MGGFRAFLPVASGRRAAGAAAGYELVTEVPAPEVLAVYPDVKADEARAEERAVHWAGEWEQRFTGREARR